MIQRMIGAALLKAAAYEEVEADESATRQALLVVLLGAIATGVAFLGMDTTNSLGPQHFGLIMILAVFGWALLALIAYLIGTIVLPSADTSANWGELARTLGFAQSPRVLMIFAFLPGIGVLVFYAISIWVLVTTVIAIRQALDYTSTFRAVIVTVLSFIPQSIIMNQAVSMVTSLIN